SSSIDLSHKTKKLLMNLKKILCCFFVAMILTIGFTEYCNGLMYSACSLIPKLNKIEMIKEYSEDYKVFIHTDDDKQSDLYQEFTQIKSWYKKYNDGNSPKIMTEFSVYINEMFDEKATDQKCENLDCFYYENIKTYLDFFKKHSNENYVFDDVIINRVSGCYSKEFNEFISNYNLVEKTTDLENNLYLYIHK
ncbi:MAG: hypothetical protein KBT46_00890, partial [Ruminococcus sp.]|nr:hypothetical protein [Candidatus Copronaster equi]